MTFSRQMTLIRCCWSQINLTISRWSTLYLCHRGNLMPESQNLHVCNRRKLIYGARKASIDVWGPAHSQWLTEIRGFEAQLVSSQTPIATQNYRWSLRSYSPHFSTPELLSSWPSPLCMFSNFNFGLILVDSCLLLYDLLDSVFCPSRNREVSWVATVRKIGNIIEEEMTLSVYILGKIQSLSYNEDHVYTCRFF